MRSKYALILVAITYLAILCSSIRSLGTVTIDFFVKDTYWGRYQSPTTAEPGDKAIPLTVVVQQRSDYYLVGVRGYLYLQWPFKDAVDDDYIADTDAVIIDPEEGYERYVPPYGSFYFTFVLDIDENATRGEYQLVLEIANHTAWNKTGDTWYSCTSVRINITVRISNRAPEVKDQEPESGSVTIYVGENETFKVNASDPDNDTIVYRWLLDNEEVLSGHNATEYTYVAYRRDKGTHTLEVRISDGDLETTVSWTINVPNRAPEVKDQNPPEDQVSMFAGDNRTFSVVAEDQDGDNITYTWYFDNDKVLEGSDANNYTYIANDSDVGTHTLVVEVSDGEDATRVTWTISVDVTSKTRITPSAEYILAGRRTNISITINNNIWQGTVEIDLSYPDYVAVFSDTHWTFRNVQPNDNLTIMVDLYVPAKVLTSFGEVELIGQTLDFTLDLSFSDIYGRSHDESHSAEFIIRGGVQLRYFGLRIKPENATIGSSVEVSLTILNVGVATAHYANASVIDNEYIDPIAESFFYIGDIEPGAPIPVVLKFKIASNVSVGVYNVSIAIYYFDDLYNELMEIITVNITVVEEIQTTTTQQGALTEYTGYAYIGIIVGTVVILALVIRRKILKG